jgi:hypothetical protein
VTTTTATAAARFGVNNLIRITKPHITKNSELNKNGSDFLFQKTKPAISCEMTGDLF